MVTPESRITVSGDRELALPSQESERLMGLRRAEWDRLRNRVAGLSKPIETASKWSDRCFGGGATALVTFATLAGSNAEVESWVLPAAGIGGLCLVGMGVILHVIDEKLDKAQSDEATNICADMDEILAAYETEAATTRKQP